MRRLAAAERDRRAALDTYSYAQVSVTAGRLTVAMKDAKGAAGARTDRLRVPAARSDCPVTPIGQRADYPPGGRP